MVICGLMQKMIDVPQIPAPANLSSLWAPVNSPFGEPFVEPVGRRQLRASQDSWRYPVVRQDVFTCQSGNYPTPVRSAVSFFAAISASLTALRYRANPNVIIEVASAIHAARLAPVNQY
jgi:hypothetical protein